MSDFTSFFPHGAPSPARCQALRRLLSGVRSGPSRLTALAALAVLGGSVVPSRSATASSPPPVARSASVRIPRPTGTSRSFDRAGTVSRVCLAGNPLCPPPDVTITPAGGTFTTAAQTITVDWCGHSAGGMSSSQILLNGVDVTSHFSYAASAKSGCATHASSTGTVTLATGGNELDASITDNIDQTGSSGAWYTYSPPPAMSVTAAPQAGERIDASNCVADCFETTFGYSLPSYVSRGVSRSLSLQYRSGRARPMGRVELNATYPGAPAGLRVALQLTYPSGGYVTFPNGSQTLYFQSSGSTTTRLVTEWDATGIATGRYLYGAIVTYLNADGSQYAPPVNLWPIGVIVVNDQASPYGVGVEVAGLQRAYLQADGILITDGSGSASYFGCNCANYPTYGAPTGDFSTLTANYPGYGYSRRYPDGTKISFDASGYETQVSDRYGNTITYAYTTTSSGARALYTVTDPAGLSTYFAYQTSGSWKVGSLSYLYQGVGPGRIAYFGIDGNNDLRDIVDVDGVYFSHTASDGLHRLAHVVDRNGGSWDYTYNNTSTAHPEFVTAPQVTTVNGVIRPQSRIREPYGAALQYVGTGGGLSNSPIPNFDMRASVADAGTHTVYYTVNKWNQTLTSTDPLLRVTTIVRDENGFPTRVTRPSGAVDEYRYSGHQLLMSRMAGHDSTNYRWSNYAQLDSMWGTRQAWVGFTHLSNGAVQTASTRYSQSAPTTYVTQVTTDDFGRVTGSTDPAGNITRMFHNGRYGNVDSVAMPGGKWTKTVADAFGRDSLHYIAGRTTTVSVADVTVYDALNRVHQTYDGEHPQPFTYDYGPVYLSAVTDPMGQQFRRDVNPLGWVTAEYDPDPSKGALTYRYTPEGLVASRTNRRGQVIETDYDPVHRMTARRSGSISDQFGYSSDDRRMASWNAISTDSTYLAANGWTDSVVTLIGGRRFRRQNLADAGQRLDSVDVAMVGGPITFAGRKYLRDATTNMLTNIRVAGSSGTAFQYDGDMFINGITYSVAGTTALRQLSYTAIHMVYADMVDLTPFNSIRHIQNFGYDSLSRLSETGILGESPLYQNVYKYNVSGTIAEHLRFNRDANCPQAPGINFPTTVDPNYGLRCALVWNGSQTNDKTDFTYDDALNHRSDVNTGRQPSGSTYSQSTQYTYDTGDRLNAILPQGGTVNGSIPMTPAPGSDPTFQRDLDGNVVRKFNSATDIRYGWDEQGRLTSVLVAPTGTTVSYDYNATGQLVRRHTNGAVDRHFLWDDGDLLAELDGSAANRIAEYVYWATNTPMAMVTGQAGISAVDYYMQDQGGNVRRLFRNAGNAPITFSSDYSTWGVPRDTLSAPSANRLRWKGMIWEGDSTQLYYARNRWYSPQMGAFMSEDPAGLAGGANSYGFADNDPINGSDPDGMSGWRPDPVDVRGLIDGLVGGAVQRYYRNHWPVLKPGFLRSPARPLALTQGPGFEAMAYGGAFLYLGRSIKPAERPIEIAGMVVTAPLFGGMGMAASEITTLSIGSTFYRGMSELEAADFLATGSLRLSRESVNGKYLTNSLESAEQWAAMFNQTPGGIVRVVVPADATRAFHYLGRTDGIGEAWLAPMDALQNARVTMVKVISLTPQ
jgi:RHS repeat-associated protein